MSWSFHYRSNSGSVRDLFQAGCHDGGKSGENPQQLGECIIRLDINSGGKSRKRVIVQLMVIIIIIRLHSCRRANLNTNKNTLTPQLIPFIEWTHNLELFPAFFFLGRSVVHCRGRKVFAGNKLGKIRVLLRKGDLL